MQYHQMCACVFVSDCEPTFVFIQRCCNLSNSISFASVQNLSCVDAMRERTGFALNKLIGTDIFISRQGKSRFRMVDDVHYIQYFIARIPHSVGIVFRFSITCKRVSVRTVVHFRFFLVLFALHSQTKKSKPPCTDTLTYPIPYISQESDKNCSQKEKEGKKSFKRLAGM